MAGSLPVESQSETLFAVIIALTPGLLVELYRLGWGICILPVLLLGISVLIDKVK